MKVSFWRLIVIIVSFCISLGTSVTTYSFMAFLSHPNANIFFLLAISMILSVILVPVRTYLMNSGCIQLEQQHKREIISATAKKSMQYLESPNYESIVSRLKESQLQEQRLYVALTNISFTIGIVLAFCYFLFYKLAAFALVNISVALFLVFLALAVNYKNAQLMYGFWQKYMENTRKYNYYSDILTKKEFVEEKKVFGYKSFFAELFDQEFDKAAASNKQLGRQRMLLESINDFIFALFIFIQLGFLIWCYYTNKIDLGFFVSFIPFAIAVFASICSAFSSISDLVQIKKFYQEYKAYIGQEQLEIGSQEPATGDGYAVRLENIGFTYPNQKTPTIKDLNLALEKGKKYALVGVNGSGKTTLTKIMGGLYKPQSGKVYCTCKPAILFQDFNRYPFTVADNIALSERMDEERLIMTLEQVGLKEKIQSLPQDDRTEATRLKEDGVEFSGGEWQRIALARILYQENDIVILDEPTASLDPFIEAEIYKQYMKLLKDQTVVFLTHRLGYLRDVDEILVLSDGVIMERGTHEELISCPDSLYNSMYQEQRRVYQDEKQRAD